MIVKGVTELELTDAMDRFVAAYGCNIQWNRKPEAMNAKGDRWRFTLTVCSSRGKFGKVNPINGRHVHALCWHGHGKFMELLLGSNPEARLLSSPLDSGARNVDRWRNYYTIWQNWQAGSMMYPYYASEACECND